MAIGPIIKNLSYGLNEIGKIKIGMKGEVRKSRTNTDYQLPQKVDHFIITTLDIDKDNNFAADTELMDSLSEFKDPDGKLRKIPITLLYDDVDLNFRCNYNFYQGKKLSCRGDGENAEERQQDGYFKPRSCPCGRLNAAGADKCKPSGILSVLIRGSNRLGGVWVFRTTSQYTLGGLIGSFGLIKQISGGVLAGIPLWLKLSPRKVADPSGKQVTIYTVTLEYDGSQEKLMQIGYNTLHQRISHQVRMDEIQSDVRKLQSSQVIEFVDDDGVISNEGIEFYPEQQDGYEDPNKPKTIEKPKRGKKTEQKQEPEFAEIIEETEASEETETSESESEEENADWGEF